MSGSLSSERWGGGRQLALLWGFVSLALLACAPFAQRLAEPLPACLFKVVLDIPCLTCGTTRAALALARLDPLAALAFNPLATLAWVGIVAGGLVALAAALAGRDLREPSWRLSLPWRVAAVAVLLANWVYLVLAGV